MAYAEWFHAKIKVGLPTSPPMPLLTGFVHLGSRFEGMERLWRRLSRGRKAGVLFIKD